MLCGFPTVQQAAIGDCLSFDPFSFDQYGLTAVEVDVGWRQIADAFVIGEAQGELTRRECRLVERKPDNPRAHHVRNAVPDATGRGERSPRASGPPL